MVGQVSWLPRPTPFRWLTCGSTDSSNTLCSILGVSAVRGRSGESAIEKEWLFGPRMSMR